MSQPSDNGVARWGVLASWAAVILALVFGIGGAIGAAIGFALQDTRLAVKGLQDRELADSRASGRYEERSDNHGRHLAELDAMLQREMRLINDRTMERLSALDIRLQDEIKHAREIGSADREAIRSLVSEVRAYQNDARAQNARQDEKLNNLEKR